MSQKGSFIEELLARQQERKSSGEVERVRGNELYAQGEYEKALECYS